MQEKKAEEINMEETEKETNTETMAEECHTEKKKKRGSCLLTFLIVLGSLFLIYAIFMFSLFLPHIETEFVSIEEFDEYGGVVLMDIPENATDIKYYCNDMFFEVESTYSFVIEDEEEFYAYIEENEYKIRNERTVSEYMENKPEYADDVFKIRDWYDYVVDDDIKEYNILYFHSFDGTYEAILVNEETGRFVAIKYATL